jgi:sugar phosphate permease
MTAHHQRPWLFMLVAAAILMVTMGMRQSLGLFVSPLNTHTGLGMPPSASRSPSASSSGAWRSRSLAPWPTAGARRVWSCSAPSCWPPGLR